MFTTPKTVETKLLGSKTVVDELRDLLTAYPNEVEIRRHGPEKDPTHLKFGITEVAALVTIMQGDFFLMSFSKIIEKALGTKKSQKIVIQTPLRTVEIVSHQNLTREEIQNILKHAVELAK